MSCNCYQNTGSLCTNCSTGLTCGCPPNWDVPVVLPDCQCCPDGYTKTLQSDGTYLCEGNGRAIATIPCNTCTDSVTTDCVFFKDDTAEKIGLCVDVADGDNLTLILAKMCITRPSNILAMLQVIGTSEVLKAALCQIVSICPSTGNSTPIPGPITVTLP